MIFYTAYFLFSGRSVMTKKILSATLLLIVALSLLACQTGSTTAAPTTQTTTTYPFQGVLFNDNPAVKSIDKVDLFPDMPANYSYYDYNQSAITLDSLLYAFANNPEAKLPAYDNNDYSSWAPIGFWIDQARQPDVYDPLVTGYLKRSFGFPTYVGDTRVLSTGSEALTTIASVLASSYVGIDKSNESYGDAIYNFAEMTMSSYDTGSKLVTNGGIQGQSFWYDIFPQILFARLYDVYPNTEYMQQIVLNGADQWLEALDYFTQDGKPYYDFVGYNVVLESPTTDGDHIEPPNGGLAFLFYSAYVLTEDEKYLDGAKQVLDYFQDYWGNPNYEALTDYAPYVAAALNYRYGTDYDIGKFLDFLFDSDATYRPGWTVMNGTFGDYAVDGLVGQSGDYAFAMNSFHLASVLAPLVKYDNRYSTAIGKYFLNLVNNAKVFFPHNIPLTHQTMVGYLPFDPHGVLCYEGFRNNYNGINGLAMGDATTMFDIPSDLSIYSSVYSGMLGSIVSETDVSGILRLDLNATDSYGMNSYPYYLYYNPYDTPMTVTYPGGNDAYDLFETSSKTLLARNVTGDSRIQIPAYGSSVVVELPANTSLQRIGNDLLASGQLIAKYQAAVNIVGLSPMQHLTSSSDIAISYSVPRDDQIVSMQIYFNDILAYDGVPIQVFHYDKSLLPDTDYTLKVVITTANGLSDYATNRVVCY